MSISRKSAEAPPTRVLIGYARVSTHDQDLSMQIDALRRAGVKDVNLYTDKQSGKTTKRKGLEAALLDARPGDVLVVFKLDRLSRSLQDLLRMSERLSAEGIELRSLNDPIDTTTPAGKFYFHLMAALAEFERSLIGWRTSKGMEAARDRGVKFGPAPKFGEKEIRKAVTMFERAKKRGVTLSANEVGREFGVTGQVVRDKIRARLGRKLWTPKVRQIKR